MRSKFAHCSCNTIKLKRAITIFLYNYFMAFEVTNMLTKLKNTISNIREEDSEAVRKKASTSVLSGQEIRICQKIAESLRQNMISIEKISKSNREDLIAYVQERQEKSKRIKSETQFREIDFEQQADKHQFTFEADLEEILEISKKMVIQIEQVQIIGMQIMGKIEMMQQVENLANSKRHLEQIKKYEWEIEELKKINDNNKQVFSTLSQQNQLYSKEMKDLQQKHSKSQKEISDKNNLIANLREEKLLLLEMRNSDYRSGIPEIQALKAENAELKKRLAFQKVKMEQDVKDGEIWRKRAEEDRQNLEKLADELRAKEEKNKKLQEKYDRSKIQIRKFKEQKSEFIKQLNMQIANLTELLHKQQNMNTNYKLQLDQLEKEQEELSLKLNKANNRIFELESNQGELLEIRQELHRKNISLERREQDFLKLKSENEQLQHKRKQLLQAMQRPVHHQIKTLQEILEQLNKFYKQYISTVFEKGNVVGFENKITVLISNVQEIKEDLLL